MKKLRGVIALIMMCVTMTGCGLQSSAELKYEGNGFKTAEDAVISFVDGLKDMNFDKMVKSYAWETQVEHYNYKSMIERYRAYVPTMRVLLPSDNEKYVSINAAGLESIEVRRLYTSVVNYILEDDVEAGITVPLASEEAIDDFMKKYSNGKINDFANIENLRFVEPEEVLGDICSSEELKERNDILGECYGADEVACVVAIADVGDKTFYYFPTVARYGKKWYIVCSWSAVNEYLGMASNQAFRITDEDPKNWINDKEE